VFALALVWLPCNGLFALGQPQGSAPTFDSVIVVTDRRVLNKQMVKKLRASLIHLIHGNQRP
jgi:hypothetical protein